MRKLCYTLYSTTWIVDDLVVLYNSKGGVGLGPDIYCGGGNRHVTAPPTAPGYTVLVMSAPKGPTSAVTEPVSRSFALLGGPEAVRVVVDDVSVGLHDTTVEASRAPLRAAVVDLIKLLTTGDVFEML